MIIQISGTPGSGKTYIGLKFKNKYNVIDTDDWMEEFYKSNLKKTKINFLKFMDKKIHNLDNKKNNLLVGMLDFFIDNELIVYPVKSKYKFFIKISTKNLFLQYNKRLINWICKNKNNAVSIIKKYNLLPFKNLNEIKKMYDDDYSVYVNKLKYILLNKHKIIDFLNNYNI